MPRCFSRLLICATLLGPALAAHPLSAQEQAGWAEQAIQILHPHDEKKKDGEQLEPGLFLIDASFKEWHPAPGHDGYLLALAERSEQDHQLGFAIETAFFTLRDGKLSLMNKGIIDSPDMAVERGILAGVTLDTAPYKINDQETAFGLRVASTYDAGSTHVAGDSFYLLRAPLDMAAGDEIYPVFDAQLDSGDAADSKKSETALVVSNHKTNGFYDLQLKAGKDTTVFLWDEASAYYQNPNAEQSY